MGLMLALSLLCCDSGDELTQPQPRLTLRLLELPAYDTTVVGPFAVWVLEGNSSPVLLGRFEATGAPLDLAFELDRPQPDGVMVTLEPPRRTTSSPSQQRIMGGAFASDLAGLSVVGFLTPNLNLETVPGAHRLGTFEEVAGRGRLSSSDAGLWLTDPRGTIADGTAYLSLTPLTPGWIYEGWVVRDWHSASEVWLSYGKFSPDSLRQVRSRDDTGPGPFSGSADYVEVWPQDVVVPGDDWLSNPMDLVLPTGVTLPLDLNGCEACGEPSRWTHLISVEPSTDQGEAPWEAEPFFIRPYANPIGEGRSEEPRAVLIRSQSLPRGEARIVR